jgi:tetratricopeptide (TPR) repeat protein
VRRLAALRAQGELGLSAFLQGGINTSIVKLGQALKVAKSNGYVASVVRCTTLFGHGYSELGRPEQTLDFYDRALKVARTVPELQFPVMTYLGKGDVLVQLGRFKEADQLLIDALAYATREGALGYGAELTYKQGLIAVERNQSEQAIDLMKRAIDLGHQAGVNRIVAEVAVDLARIQRASGLTADAERTLPDGIQLARDKAEHLLLPRLLVQLADLKASERRYAEAADSLDEDNDMLEGLLTTTSSPWVQSRVIGGMSDLYLQRIRVEVLQGHGAAAVFSVVEQAHSRSLLDLLLSTPAGDVKSQRNSGPVNGESRAYSRNCFEPRIEPSDDDCSSKFSSQRNNSLLPKQNSSAMPMRSNESQWRCVMCNEVWGQTKSCSSSPWANQTHMDSL